MRTIPVPDPPGGDHYDGWSTGDGPCYICGRAVQHATYWVHPVDGGAVLLHRDDEDAYVSDGGDLGLQPVGSRCARLVPAEYRRR